MFSTSWRTHHTHDELVEFATSGGGEDLSSRFVGMTPKIKTFDELGDYKHRERECLAWREQTGHVGDWLAIDDIEHWFSPQSRNVFITDYRTGLTEAAAKAIIALIAKILAAVKEGFRS